MLPDNIVFSTLPADDLHSFLVKKNYSSLSVLADENTYRECYPLISGRLPHHSTVVIKSGEEEKNLNTCTQIWQSMTDNRLDRHACVIILGGGVIGDMGGFCASTYKRGIDFILIPTTLLAQADASIGGKLGIDFNHLKNHIGVFQLPTLTLLHSGFLKTLPVSELRSGFAEIIKHTLISDQDMWKRISTLSLDQQPWELLLRHSVEFKAYVTTEDPTEKGLRKILNAGHTIGHAVESHLLNSGKRVLHGEAIAAGLIAESFIANKKGLLSKPALNEISSFIVSVFGKIDLGSDANQAVARLILQDKKNKGNKILCVLLTGIGHAKWDCEISLEEVDESLVFYRSC
ncbi:MAG TPA: 3-dehydroquinate synthase [Chryseolinea sp.]|nr:3-dehydroquinate synthase [Chryseolinea sp.]